MSLAKPLMLGFPPHTGMSVCPTPLLGRARVVGWDAGWFCSSSPAGDSSWREKMGCYEHARSQQWLLMAAVNGLCCTAGS